MRKFFLGYPSKQIQNVIKKRCQTFYVHLYADPVDAGQVIGSTDSAKYGDIFYISAIPNDQVVFIKWSDGNYENPRKIIIDDNVELSAKFHYLADHGEIEFYRAYDEF